MYIIHYTMYIIHYTAAVGLIYLVYRILKVDKPAIDRDMISCLTGTATENFNFTGTGTENFNLPGSGQRIPISLGPGTNFTGTGMTGTKTPKL